MPQGVTGMRRLPTRRDPLPRRPSRAWQFLLTRSRWRPTRGPHLGSSPVSQRAFVGGPGYRRERRLGFRAPFPFSGFRDASHFLSEAALSPDLFPSNKPATVRSSSNSGQWIYAPSPKISKSSRSSAEPYQSRGYQTRGTTTVRPSTRSTANPSSLTLNA